MEVNIQFDLSFQITDYYKQYGYKIHQEYDKGKKLEVPGNLFGKTFFDETNKFKSETVD